MIAERIGLGAALGLFSILLGGLSLLSQNDDQPHPGMNNVTEIIQAALFGNVTKRGDEECRQGSSEFRGNSNCTVHYGPGVIAGFTGWENFDAVAFLIYANNGHAIVIDDLIQHFHVIGRYGPHPEDDNQDSDDKIATIECTQPPGHPFLGFCLKPVFRFKRDKVILPMIGQSADRIYQRMLPHPGGDCRLFADVTGRQVINRTVSVTGAPVAIACNITSSIDNNGTAEMFGAPDLGHGVPMLSAPATASTDNLTHYDAAPPRTPFTYPLNSSNAVCWDERFCLPSGVYDAPNGLMGFSLTNVTSMTMPSNSSVSFTWPKVIQAHRNSIQDEPETWTTNKTQENDPDFTRYMSLLATIPQTPQQESIPLSTHGGGSRPQPKNGASVPTQQHGADPVGRRTLTLDVPTLGSTPEPPVLCLYTEPDYRGDVWCLGPGGDDMPPDLRGKVQSVMPHGNITAYLYAFNYSDGAGLLVKERIDNLDSRYTDAGHGTFSKSVVAAWILGPNDPVNLFKGFDNILTGLDGTGNLPGHGGVGNSTALGGMANATGLAGTGNTTGLGGTNTTGLGEITFTVTVLDLQSLNITGTGINVTALDLLPLNATINATAGGLSRRQSLGKWRKY